MSGHSTNAIKKNHGQSYRTQVVSEMKALSLDKAKCPDHPPKVTRALTAQDQLYVKLFFL